MAGIWLHKTTVVERSHLLKTYLTNASFERWSVLTMPDRPTVIFADDNLKVREIACTLLSATYTVVKVAVDGEEAVRSICELQPDFAVLDHSMPKMDGIRVARQLRQAGLCTKVAFVTLTVDED